jgi:hypothetical protein
MVIRTTRATLPRLRLAIAAVTLMIAPHPSAAQAPPEGPDPPRAVELTPFVALGSTQSSLFGAALAFPWTRALSLEGEVGYRQGDVKGMTADMSLIYGWPRARAFVPYVAAGIGLREYGVPLPAPGGGLFTQPKMALAVNAGGGLAVPIDARWSFRTDARWFNGLGSNASEHWRLFTGVSVRLSGTTDARDATRK